VDSLKAEAELERSALTRVPTGASAQP
jgi:hypothetical protein